MDVVAKGARYKGGIQRCYILTKDILRDKFTELLRDPSFQFEEPNKIDEQYEIEIELQTEEINKTRK